MHIGLIPAVRFEESSQRAIPVIGLFYLASYCEKYGKDIKVTIYRTPEEIIAAKPDIAGISTVTENMNIALDWAKKIKEGTGSPVFIGGDHISALPHTLDPIFDAGILGEGEATFLELVQLIQNNDNWKDKLDGIAGICRHSEDKVEINPPRPLITPIETIPFPRREKHLWGGFVYCFSSRGCPYHCSFCSPTVMWKKYRVFPAEYVIAELDEIFSNFNPYYIHFFDDLFIGDKERIKKLKTLVRQRGYHKRVVFGGHIRADLMDDEMCENLRFMNFNSGAFGAESGSDKVLQFLKCGSSTVEMNQQAIDICYKWGIQMNLSFIIGTPGETEDDLKKTIAFIEKNKKKFNGIEVFILLPYPGTPVWTLAKRKGLVKDSMNWDLFRTKAYFSELEVDDDFLYLNDALDRKTFRKYVKIFQDIDADLNKDNKAIYETIEKSVADKNKPAK
ncbi:MAG: B12-binding domain-containing radical SAM protein [Firmicutes bacterium]|nr:B12-binding domain-containing radical SAM protein [Bacillota bacterium]